MYINAQKSKIMVVSRQDNISVQVDHEGESLEQVHDFKFLGSNKSADGDCTKEIKRRIVLPNRMGPGKRVNGKSGEAEITIFWPYYSGKCRTVGTYSPRRNDGRVTASRQTEKTVDTRH